MLLKSIMQQGISSFRSSEKGEPYYSLFCCYIINLVDYLSVYDIILLFHKLSRFYLLSSIQMIVLSEWPIKFKRCHYWRNFEVFMTLFSFSIDGAWSLLKHGFSLSNDNDVTASQSSSGSSDLVNPFASFTADTQACLHLTLQQLSRCHHQDENLLILARQSAPALLAHVPPLDRKPRIVNTVSYGWMHWRACVVIRISLTGLCPWLELSTISHC